MSDLHLYLTAPFVLSWSLLNAMSAGLTVLASDVPPVREVIEPGVNGLIAPLFDVDGLAETALKVLDDPAQFAPLGVAGSADDRGAVLARRRHPFAQGLLRASRGGGAEARLNTILEWALILDLSLRRRFTGRNRLSHRHAYLP